MHQALVSHLFRPRSIAIVGASERNFYARNAIERLSHCGYGGEVYLVNRRTEEVFGRRCYDTPAEIGAPIDLAFIAVPRVAVLGALESCAAAGAKAAVVVSNGFGESSDPEGRGLQAELAAFLARTPIALCGPSCLGVINVVDRMQAFGGHPGTEVPSGGIALVSQSGANVHSYIAAALARNLGYTHIASSGNEAGLETADYIEYFLEQPATRVVCAFVESFRSPSGSPRSPAARAPFASRSW